jgi:hypothetical protein
MKINNNNNNNNNNAQKRAVEEAREREFGGGGVTQNAVLDRHTRSSDGEMLTVASCSLILHSTNNNTEM